MAVGTGLLGASPARSQTQVAAPVKPWDSVQFDVTTRGRTFPGISIRLPGDAGDLFTACRICTHQGCVFGYETNYRVVSDIVDVKLANPVLLCRCHLSVYDPAHQGRVLFGPAPRPPWRIEARQNGGTLVIGAVEDGAGEFGSG